MTYVTVKLFTLIVFNTATGSIAVDSGPGQGYTLKECRSAAQQAKRGVPKAWRPGIKASCRKIKTIKRFVPTPDPSPTPITDWPSISGG